MLIAERGLRQMAKVTEKLELLRELREHPDRYVRGGKMFPFPYLNEFNTKKGSPTE
jgi:hypothetical protein